jgi:antitoxin VapB
MALSIKMPEADRLARRLAETTGETITIAVLLSLRERLDRVERRRISKTALLEEIRAISHHCASLPTLDTRSDDEILGYDENGIPA